MQPYARRSMPVAFFGMALGTLALSNAWRAANRLWHLTPVATNLLTGGALALWIALLVAYGLNWVRQPAAAIRELRDPQQSSYFALMPTSSLLAACAILPFTRVAAIAVFVASVVMQLSWGVVAHGRFWKGTDHPSGRTPALYLSSVAPNFVAGATAAALGWDQLGALFFGAGVVYWILIETLILNGVASSREMDRALRPAIGVQLAPPVVGGLAWLSLHPGAPDMFSHLLLGYGLYQVLLVLRLLPWILERPFAPSYWAFSFGVAALPTMAMRMVEWGETGVIAWLAPGLFIVANLIIALLVAKTLGLLLRGRLLPMTSGLPGEKSM